MKTWIYETFSTGSIFAFDPLGELCLILTMENLQLFQNVKKYVAEKLRSKDEFTNVNLVIPVTNPRGAWL